MNSEGNLLIESSFVDMKNLCVAPNQGKHECVSPFS